MHADRAWNACSYARSPDRSLRPVPAGARGARSQRPAARPRASGQCPLGPARSVPPPAAVALDRERRTRARACAWAWSSPARLGGAAARLELPLHLRSRTSRPAGAAGALPAHGMGLTARRIIRRHARGLAAPVVPFGIVLAGIAPRPNLLALCAASRHALLVAPPLPVSGGFERIYPIACGSHAQADVRTAADFDVLSYAGRGAEPAGALIGAAARRLWCWHGDDPATAKRLFALLRGHLPHDLLLSADQPAQRWRSHRRACCA